MLWQRVITAGNYFKWKISSVGTQYWGFKVDNRFIIEYICSLHRLTIIASQDLICKKRESLKSLVQAQHWYTDNHRSPSLADNISNIFI
jgi:hypothetical protein